MYKITKYDMLIANINDAINVFNTIIPILTLFIIFILSSNIQFLKFELINGTNAYAVYMMNIAKHVLITVNPNPNSSSINPTSTFDIAVADTVAIGNNITSINNHNTFSNMRLRIFQVMYDIYITPLY